MKVCSKCGGEFPATTEYWHRKNNGLQPVCKQCACTSSAIWRLANPEKARQVSKHYYDANRDKVLEGYKRWKEANRERLRVASAAYYVANRERILNQVLLYQQNNPEVGRMGDHYRRARKAGALVSHTRWDIRQIYNDQDGLCFWCDCELGGKWHVDHLIPLGEGGSDGPENLVIACSHCNMSKGNTDPLEFLERVVRS